VERLAPELRSAPLVFVDDLHAPELRLDDLRHLRRSLRLGRGDPVCLADGAGGWRTAVLGASGPGELGPLQQADVRAPSVTVGLAIPKGTRLDVAVTKLTELGVDRVVLLAAERSVVRWAPADVGDRLERLGRVAREASMQCRRLRLPEIAGILSVEEIVARCPGEVALAEPGGPAPSLSRPVVLVGPEGGWTDDELAAGDGRVGLGPTVLRVETAAIAAGVALCGQRAGWLPSVADPHGESFP
jgi:16S rRNA (uracil1498-N3)-methyltransferase